MCLKKKSVEEEEEEEDEVNDGDKEDERGALFLLNTCILFS